MDGIPLRTRIYVYLLGVAFAVGVALSYSRQGFEWSAWQTQVAAILVVMIAGVERYKVEFPSRFTHFRFTVGAILCLGAALALEPLQAATTVVVASLVVDLSARLQPIQWVNNVANIGLSTLTASHIYWVFAGDADTPLDTVPGLLGTVVASVAYTVINLGALALIVAPVLGESPVSMWRSNFSAFVVFVSMPMLGSLVPITADSRPIGILILAVPLAGAHFALRTLKNVELQTQATIISLSDALELRDAYTHHHSARVTEYVQAILDEMPHLPSRVRLMTIEAARIHDVGKVGIRDTSLLKPGPLTDDERREMQRHSEIGADIVGNLEMYRHGASVVRHHHERWDGKGYPDGLKGEEIPFGARIIAVADSFDAMTSDRPYRRALTFSAALAEIRRNSGQQFDPAVVEAFEQAMTKPYPSKETSPVPATNPAD
jgi:HD-GYP domain-containing protein (c-di-GMP phosphodiesterase class II)